MLRGELRLKYRLEPCDSFSIVRVDKGEDKNVILPAEIILSMSTHTYHLVTNCFIPQCSIESLIWNDSRGDKSSVSINRC